MMGLKVGMIGEAWVAWRGLPCSFFRALSALLVQFHYDARFHSHCG